MLSLPQNTSHKIKLVFIPLVSMSFPRAMRPDIHILISFELMDLARLMITCGICTSVWLVRRLFVPQRRMMSLAS